MHVGPVRWLESWVNTGDTWSVRACRWRCRHASLPHDDEDLPRAQTSSCTPDNSHILLNYYYNHFTARWTLSGTTRMSRYQKKHSPAHTYRGHQSSLICFPHLLRSMVSSLLNLCTWQSFSTISLRVFFDLPLGLAPSTSYSIHFFTQSLSFLQHMAISSQPILLYYQNYVI